MPDFYQLRPVALLADQGYYLFCGSLARVFRICNPSAILRHVFISCDLWYCCLIMFIICSAAAFTVPGCCGVSWRQYSRLLPLFTVIYRYRAIYPAVLKFFFKKNENSEKIPVILILDNRCPFVHGMFHTKSISETTIFYPKGEFEL